MTDPNESAGQAVRAFAREYLRSPVHTASLFPSLPPLCRVAIAPLPEHGDVTVVDLGAGTGQVTAEIQQRLRGRGRHIAVEFNPRMAELLQRRFPDVEVLCADAHDAVADLRARGVRADLVASSLPWLVTAPPSATGRRTIFPALGPLVGPHGAVTQIAHAWIRFFPTAKQVQRNLEAAFEEVVVSRTVLANMPPAVVYVARRPRGSEREDGAG